MAEIEYNNTPFLRAWLSEQKGPRLPQPEEKVKVRQSRALLKLESKIANLQDQINDLRRQAEEEKGHQRIVCPHCNKQPRINECTYIQTHWYVRPHGCTGGDYWNQGEGRFRCPRCQKETRLYKKPEIEKLKRYFAKVIEEHD